MTVATRLDIIATGQDKVSAVLRQVNSQLAATADKLREAKRAADEGPDVDGLFVRSRDRRMAAAADERRQAVMAARLEREAAQAKAASISITDRATEGVQRAARAQEFFNKVIGTIGFVGAIGGAVVALIGWLNGLSSYSKIMKEVQAQQARFNDLLREVGASVRTKEIERMSEGMRELAKAQDEVWQGAAKHLDLQVKLVMWQAALAANEQKRAQWGNLNLDLLKKDNYASESLKKLDSDRERLTKNIAEASALLPKYADDLQIALRAATPEYANHLRMVRDIIALQNQIKPPPPSEIEAAGKAIEVAKKAAKEAGKGDKKPPRGGGGIPRVESLRREIDLERAATDIERLRLQGQIILDDRHAKRITRAEATLLLEQNNLRIANETKRLDEEATERNKRFADEQAKRATTLRGELDLLAAKNEQERIGIRLKQDLQEIQRQQQRGEVSPEVAALMVTKARTEAEKELSAILRERRVKSIEDTGGAIKQTVDELAEYEPRLAGVGKAVDDMTKVFALFEQGQVATKDAVVSGIGAFGTAAAGFAKNKKDQAWILGAFHQIEALASLAYLDFAGAARHQGVAIAAFAFAGRGGGKGGGQGSGSASSSAPTGGSSASGGGSYASQFGADRREVIMVGFPNGIVYGMSGEVAKAAEQAADNLDGTGMQQRRF